MSATKEKVKSFRDLHEEATPFVIPNPWDAGSARILEGLGFKALATTSSGFALTKGRRDYGVPRDEALDHCREIAAAVDIPVTADLENGFGDAPADAAETIRLAAETGLCGGSIEDSTGDANAPIYELNHAVERVAATVEAARAAPNDFVLTARAEAFLHIKPKLDDVIARLVAFEEAGADVLYAPGLPDMEAVEKVCAALSKPVNVLIIGKLAKHDVQEFTEAGAKRLSIGGGLAWKAYASLASAKTMLSDGNFNALSVDRDDVKTVGSFLK